MVKQPLNYRRGARNYRRSAQRTDLPAPRARLPLKASELLGDADEVPAPRTVLRRADADAGAVADLVLLVEGVDHIEAHREALEAFDVERVTRTDIDLTVVGQVGAVGMPVPVGRSRLSPRAGA